MALKTPEADQCPAKAFGQEGNEDFAVGWFEGAILSAFVLMWLVGFALGRIHGWHYGREHRLHERHIGYERISSRCKELEEHNEKLKESVAQYRRASYSLGRGLSSLRDENYDIAEFVMLLEAKVEEGLQLRGLIAQQKEQLRRGYRVMKRVTDELVTHSQLCPFRSSIWICRAGRVWHSREDCKSIGHGSPVEWSPCTFCASRTSPPYINDVNGRNLLDDLSEWMQLLDAEDHMSAGGL